MLSNFYPIEIPFETFQIQRIEFDAEVFRNLKINFHQTHSFFRHENYIYASPFIDNGQSIGDLVTLSVNENHRVVGALLRHIFFRVFTGKFSDIRPLGFYPFKFLSRQLKHDYVYNILPDNLKGRIAFRKQTEIQFRNIEIADKPVWGLVITSFYRWQFSITCLELLHEGFEITDREVIHTSRAEDTTLSMLDEHSVGRLISLQNGKAIVDTNAGQVEYPLGELTLNRSKENIQSYLNFKIGEFRTKQVFDVIMKNDPVRYNAKMLHDEMDATATMLSTLVYENADGFTFSINNNSDIEVKTFRPENPVFVFSIDGYKKSPRPDEGLKNFGPWDSLIFDIKKPKILVVCHRNNRGIFSSFLGKLKNGLPNEQWFKMGMVNKYKLQDIEFIIEEIPNYTTQAYIETIKKSIRLNSDSLFNLAIVETKNEWKTFSTENNPYYHVKAYLLSLGIPVQFIITENAKKIDKYLDPLLNSLALQMYAKLGGTPWALPATSNIDREIIIGIGSSTLRSNSFTGAAQSKIVGITTFFSSDGTYLFGNKCRDVSYTEYFDELLSNLKSSITELSRKDAWNPGDTIRIVFHVFKPIKNVEAEVVGQLVSMFYQYNIRYSFVTITDAHPFMFFDMLQAGVNAGNSVKGQYIPLRGTAVILSDTTCLLQMKGPQQIKTDRQGASRPVLIHIHEKSTYKDLYYITQQIYNFTNLSWRSFLPAQMPVTLYYSDLIAEMLGRLRQISSWNPEVINGDLKFKKWFL